jgi:hypothetical protein
LGARQAPTCGGGVGQGGEAADPLWLASSEEQDSTYYAAHRSLSLEPNDKQISCKH